MENNKKHYTRDEINNGQQSFSMGLIIRQKEPNNLETPVDRIDSFLTPTELFYVRSHSPAVKRKFVHRGLRNASTYSILPNTNV